jgi:hypothetical protein
LVFAAEMCSVAAIGQQLAIVLGDTVRTWLV